MPVRAMPPLPESVASKIATRELGSKATHHPVWIPSRLRPIGLSNVSVAGTINGAMQNTQTLPDSPRGSSKETRRFWDEKC